MSLFDFFSRKNKKVQFFILTKKSDPERFLCLAVTKEEAFEYAHTTLRFAHNAHYQAWCALRDYDYKSPRSWDEYFDTCIDYEEKSEYIITSVTYRLKDIAAIMRMFGGCSPIGCSFETPVEYEHAKNKKEILECQMEFERFWREHHKEEIEEASHGAK